MAEFQLDTVDALMARYAAGMLPEPARVLVEAHLEMKSVNHSKVSVFEAAAGTVVESMEPNALASRDETLKRIFAAPLLESSGRPNAARDVGGLPRAIRAFVGMDLSEIPWRRKLPGFKEYDMGKIDGWEVSFLHIRAGRTMPAHTHEGYELTLILDGNFTDSRGRFAKGDIAVADDSVDHRPVAGPERPCIAFAVCDAPLKLTGSFRQLLGDLIG